MLTHSDAPDDQVWFVWQDAWFVGIGFSGGLWSPLDVMGAMEGVAPKEELSEIAPVEGHADRVLRVLDRLHGDRAAAARANELLSRRHTNEHAGANYPCWCGSGRKFKRCHGTQRRP